MTHSDNSAPVESLEPCPVPCCVDQIILGRHTNHFQWCTNGCCHRVVSLMVNDSSTDEERERRLDTQVVVVNDVPFDSEEINEVCASVDGQTTCGQRCAALLLPGKRCASDVVTVPNVDFNLENDACTSPSTANDVPSGNSTSTDEDSSSESNSGPPCFPASSTAQLLNDRRLRMNQLSIGDFVLCNDQQQYSPIIGFSHQDNSVMRAFRRVILDSGDVLVATHGHYVYRKGDTHDTDLVRMDEVNIDDIMILANGSKSCVVHTEDVVDRGLYNPQTACGDIVVNSVVVSAYTTAIKPSAAHALLLPARVATCFESSTSIVALLIDKSSSVGRWFVQRIR